jgi:hypothetical protein
VPAGGVLLSLLTGGAISLGGCGDDSTSDQGTPQTTVEILYPDAEPLPGYDQCTVVMTTSVPITSRNHRPTCTDIEYPMNPPCGGDHWAEWAEFGKYTTPIPRPAYVHNQEHGAVVLLYRCPEDCPEIVHMLEEVFDEVATDVICATQMPPPNARMLLSPDPEISEPIAAAAWGATYTATCIDKASLSAFVASAYGKGPEATCAQGRPLDALSCDGGGGGAAGGGGG